MLFKPHEEVTGSIYGLSLTVTAEKTRSNDSKSLQISQGSAAQEKNLGHKGNSNGPS